MHRPTAEERAGAIELMFWSDMRATKEETATCIRWTKDYIAKAIRQAEAAAVEREREECAMLHESINPASDEERLNGDPGAGAMAAIIEYRDAIRNRSKP